MVDFSKVVNRKGTYCTQWDFIADRFGDNDLLPFSISDMDFQTPLEILNSFKKRIDHGIFGYSRWNHGEYKNAISTWYKKRFNYEINENWIAYSPNVIYGLVKMLHLLSKEKPNKHQKEKEYDVLLFTPAYDGFSKIINGNSYKFTNVHIREDLTFSREDFEKKCSQSNILLLCNPNNPNGKVWSYEELEFITKIAKKYGVFIISDDIHMDIVYEKKSFTPIIKVGEDIDYIDKIIIITSNSKTFNLASIGGAYALIPNNSIKEGFLSLVSKEDSVGSPMILSVLSIISGYNYCDYWVDELNKYLYNNLHQIAAFLKDNNLNIKFQIPQGTYLAWLNCKNLNLSSLDIQAKLKSAKVAIMSGDNYLEIIPHLRLNVACPQLKLEQGLKKLRSALLTYS